MAHDSKPLNIRHPRRANTDDNGASVSPEGLGFGTPSGRRMVTPSNPVIANIPPRSVDGLPASFGGRSTRPRTPFVDTNGASTPCGAGAQANDGTSRANLEDVTEGEIARVIRRHLVSRRGGDSDDGGSMQNEGVVDSESLSARPENAAQPQGDSELFPIPFDAPGGDITHGIYKWEADQRRQAKRPRAASFAALSEPRHPAFEHIHEPGGFRRNYVLLRANDQGVVDRPVANNFIEFLYLFGHFAGEDLEEDEDEDEDKDEGEDELAIAEAGSAAIIRDVGVLQEGAKRGALKDLTSETAPLMQRSAGRSTSRMRRSRRGASVGPLGDATVTQAVLMLLKSFIGTGVLFLGKAFFNGGIVFSTVTLVFIALISLHSFLLLVKTKFVVPGSFGDIGGKLYGPWMRYSILFSIILSQLGFVCAYTIFVSENLQAFILAVTNCLKVVSVQYLILLQLIIFLPLALVRNIAKLSSTALVADVFILLGLVYIFGSEIAIISDRGIAKVELFNPRDFPLLIGTAVFSFEGVGLVIPITDSMREPRKFPAVLTWVMMFLIVLFGGSGVLAYLAFGPDIQTLVITNLDTDSKFVQGVQFLYSLAILLSVPLQLFPAVRIMENGIFTRSGKESLKVKWQKNVFRFLIVIFCALVSWAGAGDLDKFVALVGSFACVPLCYVYPALLHYKACARTFKAKIADILLLIFGVVAAVYTTVQTISLMAVPAGPSTKFGKCEL